MNLLIMNKKSIDQIKPVSKIIDKYCKGISDKDIYFMKEICYGIIFL